MVDTVENSQIEEFIVNLKGRKGYEEKKASKLGFTSLYSYFEDKILKEKQTFENQKKKQEEIKSDNKLENKEKKSCGCC